MSQESLSALLDDECSAKDLDALLDALERSPELKDQWSRMCVAREVRAGTRVSQREFNICDGVMAAIAAEAPVAAAATAKVVQFPAASRPERVRTLSWKPAIGMALAASVGAVAITLGFNLGTVKRDGGLAGIDSSATAEVADGAIETASGYAGEDLSNYVIEHSNTLADRGVGGALSYARFAARTGDQAFAQPATLTTDGIQR